jgi:cation diffusion facilitator family transporter
MSNVVNHAHRERKSSLAVSVGLAFNLFLAALKTSIGILGHSPALLADGINSTSDVAYYLVVSVFIRLARKPADVEHPYGHRQLESIAALIVGSFVITTAIAIFWNAINTVYDLLFGQGDFEGAALITLWMALLTVAIKLGLTAWTSRIGRQAKNPAVLALAYDHRNDVYSASAAAIGIFLGLMGYHWVDPLAAALVALVILRTGIEILRESTADLMDTVPGKALAQQVTEVLGTVPGVRQIDEIHAHRFGPYMVINITVGVDGSLSVEAGDEIACQVEQSLYQHIEFLRRVYVHYHPARTQPEKATAANLICEPYEQ